MSLADKIFKEMCNSILIRGTSTEGEKVRPHWKDGTEAYTIKKFGVVNRYNLQEEFPALTLRRTGIKTCMEELLWIWQRKSNNINNLKSSIWDEWADDEGSIGYAYGYQIGKRYNHHSIPKEKLTDEIVNELSEYPSSKIVMQDGKAMIYLDQIDAVIFDLKHNPFSRRIMTNIYTFEDLHLMHLYPCAYSVTFNVTLNKEGKMVLNAILNQRSQDVLAANNWNVCQYAILLMMIAQTVDMIPGELVHVIADAHIYDRHVNIIKELISRKEYPAPKVWLTPGKSFYEFTTDDIHIENYETGDQIKNIPIAI